MLINNLYKFKNNLKQNYDLYERIRYLILNLHSSLKFKNIGISESNKIYNIVFSEYHNNDYSNLSYLDLDTNLFIKKKQILKSNNFLKHENKVIELNNYIDDILEDLSKSLFNEYIFKKKLNYKNFELINIIKISIKQNDIHNSLSIYVPAYHHSTKYRPLSYRSEFIDKIYNYELSINSINNRIYHITKVNEELLNNKIKQLYYLMNISCIFNNQYTDITNIINKFIGYDIFNKYNFKTITDFYYNNKEIIEITIYSDFKYKLAEYIKLF